MKTFIPFKVGQCIRRNTQSVESTGFSYHIPQGESLESKGSVFVFVHSIEPEYQARSFAQMLVSEYCSMKPCADISSTVAGLIDSLQESAHVSLIVLVIKGNQSFLFEHGSIVMSLYRDGCQFSFANQTGDRVKSMPVQLGDIFCLASLGLNDSLSSDVMLDCIRAKEEDLNHTAYGILQACEHAFDVSNQSIAIIEVVDIPSTVSNSESELLPHRQPLTELTTTHGLNLVSTLSLNERSHTYLVKDGDTHYVLKVPATSPHDINSHEQLLQQRWLLERIENPLVVSVIDKQMPFDCLMTEFLPYPAIDVWLKDVSPNTDQIVNLVVALARVLLSLHRGGVIHRDIAKHSVVVDNLDRPHIVSVGSAYICGIGSCGDVSSTADLPPELLQGFPGDESSDQYMLAALMARLFAKDFSSQLDKIKQTLNSKDLALNPTISSALLKALQPEGKERFGDMGEFIHAITHTEEEGDHVFDQRRQYVINWKVVSLLLGLGWLITVIGFYWR